MKQSELALDINKYETKANYVKYKTTQRFFKKTSSRCGKTFLCRSSVCSALVLDVEMSKPSTHLLLCGFWSGLKTEQSLSQKHPSHAELQLWWKSRISYPLPCSVNHSILNSFMARAQQHNFLTLVPAWLFDCFLFYLDLIDGQFQYYQYFIWLFPWKFTIIWTLNIWDTLKQFPNLSASDPQNNNSRDLNFCVINIGMRSIKQGHNTI